MGVVCAFLAKTKVRFHSKKLVNKRQSPHQPRINPAFRPKVRKADGNVGPIATFIPEPLIDAGNPHKIRGSGFFGGCCRLVLNCVVWY